MWLLIPMYYSKMVVRMLRSLTLLSLITWTLNPSPIALAQSKTSMALTADKINADRDAGRDGGGNGDGGQVDGGVDPDTDNVRGTDPYKAVPDGYGLDTVNKWVESHRTAKGGAYRYVYLPADIAANKETANVLRVAAGKAWNHLSLLPEIDVPEDVSEGAGLVFALDIRKVWGADADRNWSFLVNCTPKSNIRISPAPEGDCERMANDAPLPIPQFVFNATNGGPYANIFKTPPSFDSFERKFNPGPITHVSTHKNAIVCGPRISAYRTIDFNGQKLLYSYTTDEFDGRDQGSIRYNDAPTDRDQRGTGALRASPNDDGTAVASEWWMQLPNGFMYYGIHGEGSQERGRGEFPFAIDPGNWKQNSVLATGRSCITCHTNGIQSAPSDVEFAGRNGWTSNEDLTKLYNGTRDKFKAGMRTLVAGLSDGDKDLNERMVNGTVEVVSKAIMIVEGPYEGNGTGSCRSFCNGKFGPSRGADFCASMPAR